MRLVANFLSYVQLKINDFQSGLVIIIVAASQHNGNILFELLGSLVSALLTYIGYLFLLAVIDYIETTEFILIAIEKKNKEEKDNKDKTEANETEAE